MKNNLDGRFSCGKKEVAAEKRGRREGFFPSFFSQRRRRKRSATHLESLRLPSSVGVGGGAKGTQTTDGKVNERPPA